MMVMIMVTMWSGVVVIQAAHHQDDTSSLPCSSVYLAKSSTREAGWGIFAARDYQIGDTIVSTRRDTSFCRPVVVVVTSKLTLLYCIKIIIRDPRRLAFHF